MKFGIRNATQKASVTASVPNTLPIKWSRNNPNTRLTMVMLPNEATERSIDGRFRADAAGGTASPCVSTEPEPGI